MISIDEFFDGFEDTVEMMRDSFFNQIKRFEELVETKTPGLSNIVVSETKLPRIFVRWSSFWKEDLCERLAEGIRKKAAENPGLNMCLVLVRDDLYQDERRGLTFTLDSLEKGLKNVFPTTPIKTGGFITMGANNKDGQLIAFMRFIVKINN